MKIGGAQLLFIRLAKELAKIKELEVFVIDYSGGYLESKLTNQSNIKILNFNNTPVVINKKTTIITPFTNILNIDKLVKIDVPSIGLLLYAIHSDGIKYILYKNGRRWFGGKQKAKDMIKYLSDNGNIIYMDKANYDAVKEDIDISASYYLPIPAEAKGCAVLPLKKYGDVINIGWLGRICYYKIHSIIKIADEIKNINSNRKIVFHIIGEGDKKQKLTRYLNSIGIDYRVPGILEEKKLSDYIDENIDMGVAMGTSCLEFAYRKIPSLLIDFSEKPFPKDVRYNWLFETELYTLGSELGKATHRNHDFSDILEQLELKSELGQLCYNYVIQNHSIIKTSSKLFEHLNNIPDVKTERLIRLQKLVSPKAYEYFYKCGQLGKKIIRRK